MFRGSKFILLAGDGGAPEVFTQVAACRSTGIAVAATFGDTSGTTKTRWAMKVSTNKKSVTISLSGKFTDAATLALMQHRAVFGGAYNYRLYEESGSYWYGSFLIESMNLGANIGDVESYSFSMVSAGPIGRVYVPIPPDDEELPEGVLETDLGEPLLTDAGEYILWS